MMRCWYYRWSLASAVDDQQTLSEALRRHLDRCAACRTYFEAQHSVSQALVGEATESPATKAEAEARFFPTALPEPALVSLRISSPLRRGLPWAALAAGLLVLLYAGVHRHQQQRARQASAAALLDVVSMPSHVASSWVEKPALWMNASYAREMKRLSQDADRAVRFLAQCTALPLGLPGDTDASPDDS